MPKAYRPKTSARLQSTLIGRPKKAKGLRKAFMCLVCQDQNSVCVKLNRKLGYGVLSCNVCHNKFQAKIHHLCAEVDVYSQWVDAMDAVAKQAEALQEEARDARSSSEKSSLATTTSTGSL